MNQKDKPESKTFYYTTEDLKEWIKVGKIPREIGERELRYIDEQNGKFSDWQQFKMDNPEVLEADQLARFHGVPKMLTHEEITRKNEDMTNIVQLQELLESMGDNNISQSMKPQPKGEDLQLFNEVNQDNDFGISNIMACLLYNLVDLLKLKLNAPSFGSTYEAVGKMTNSCGYVVSLIYTFDASSREDAGLRMAEYKKIMKTSGLKLWMAYWKVANLYGGFEYTCPFIEIMKCMSDSKRTTTFSVKEKQEYWNITKILKRTTIRKDQIIATAKKKKKTTSSWRQQDLVTIIGGEELVGDKYPHAITVRLLDAPNNKEFPPILYKNETLLLDPRAILLAFNTQTRSWHLRTTRRDSNPKWADLYSLSNIEETAKANPRMAKSIIRKKLENFKSRGIIDSYEETKDGIRINYENKRKKI